MAYADQIPGGRRLSTIAGVALVHGVIGYALVSGMAVEIMRRAIPSLTVTNVPLDVPPPPPLDTPPPMERSAAQPTSAPLPRLAPRDPVFVLPAPDWPVTLPLDAGPAPTPLPSAAPTAVDPAPAPSLAAAAGVRGDRATWITTQDYPPSALRAEEQGSVGIAVAIGSDGRVTSCTVTASSGSTALDQATCRLYQRRARFTPARDAAGAAVPGTHADRVRWQLP